MNIAAGILGVLFSIALLAQSMLVNVGGLWTESEELSAGSAFGVIAALLMLVGGALSFDATRAAPYPFLAATAFAIVGAWSSSYSDLWFWSGVGLTLALTTIATSEHYRATHRRCTSCDEDVRRSATTCRHCGASSTLAPA